MPPILSDDEAPEVGTEGARWKARYHQSQLERDRLARLLEAEVKKNDLLVSIDSTISTSHASWTTPKKPRSGHVGIAELLLSDLHFDEVIPARSVNFVNAYDDKIAAFRLRRTIEKTIIVAKQHIAGITYEGICVYLNGDVFSGLIHEELQRTNVRPMAATFDFWIDPMLEALRTLADEFKKVQVVVRVGNHGRESRDVVYKGAVESNWDWLFGRILHRELGSDGRFSWDIPHSTTGVVQHFDTRYLVKHGNDSKGGSGISGLLTPLSLNEHRSRKVQQAIGDPFDVMVVGHWHTYMVTPGFIINGSLKGYDEYAKGHNFGFEPPQQAFWVTTPEHGPGFHVPIRPADRAKEGW